MSARTLTNVVNDQTVALNALIYGYAGHSLVTPHAALQQIWWTEERINEKVTQEFVTSRLQPQERERLTFPVGFGDLSDDTYIEWILEKARRLFLVLAEVGEADRIFAVVDRSWDDDDLPLQMDDIEQLALSNRRDNHANARFYHTQFSFCSESCAMVCILTMRQTKKFHSSTSKPYRLQLAFRIGRVSTFPNGRPTSIFEGASHWEMPRLQMHSRQLS
jgi:hypothetical protein